MGKKYLIDTNVIIDFASGKFSTTTLKEVAKIIDENPIISIINKIELLGFKKVAPQILLFANQAKIFGLDDDIANFTIQIRKQIKIKLPDAIIAATAIQHNLVLLTSNISDFNKIDFLEVIQPTKL